MLRTEVILRRMRLFLRRHRLWAAFLAAFVPLAVLLVLQYHWLVKLEDASAAAHQASLTNFLEAVATEVKYFYGSNAERALNLSPSMFVENRCERASMYFKKRKVSGARRLFVVNLEGDHAGETLFFDPTQGAGPCQPQGGELRAVSVAIAPWKLLSNKAVPVEQVSLSVEEKDPENRMILLPITDFRSRVVGVAGLIVDVDHFKRVVLPEVIERVLPCSFTDPVTRDNLIVTVRDGRGDLVFATGEVRGGADEVTRPLPFVFGDWRLGLRSRYITPEQWARANFGVNLSLAVFIAGVLLSGIVMALRMASRELKLSEMKSDFVSNVSHELRTPLSSIRVFAEFLKHGRAQSADKVKEYGEYIENESRRLTQLINNILDFSKIESGHKTYRMEPTDLAEVVGDVIQVFQVRSSHAGFRISFRAPQNRLPAVRIDSTAIAQAVHNLLDNAVKYSGEARDIEVGVRRQGPSAVVWVRDHGIGIDRDEQSKVFERFHRVGSSLVHDVKGSGLGLSIVNHVVRAHRGKVTLESEPGRGSTFSIWLPLEAEAESEAAVPAPSGA